MKWIIRLPLLIRHIMQLPLPILRQRPRIPDIPSGVQNRVHHSQQRDIWLRDLVCTLEDGVELKLHDDDAKGGVDVE